MLDNDEDNRFDLIEVEGVILDKLPNSRFLVELKNGFPVYDHLGGKMRRHRIHMCAGDRVIVEMSPYDLSRGRIIFRLSQGKAKKHEEDPDTNDPW